ncbi:MAG: T9SS type A sorting domain-containing protein [Hymenobacteraceae bacterium]|nr:T9SS type A sorting domain-containing protein [Hymenobacteraceae bacterium]
MLTSRLLLSTVALTLTALVSGRAQSLRPPLAAPAAPLIGFRFNDAVSGGRACQKGHLAGQAAQRTGLARRVSSESRRHERLMNRYDVTYAHLDMALERTVTTLGVGSNVETWARNRPGAGVLDTLGFELHPSLTLDSVQINGRIVPAARIVRTATGAVRVRPLVAIAPGAPFRYRAWYHGTPTPTGAAAIGDGISSGNSQSWGNRVTWTLSQPFSAYEWWPCKQMLSDKLDSASVWVTTSATNKVGSNGVLEAVTPRPGGKMRYEWKSRYPIDYYLVSASVAEYVDYTIYAHPAAMAGDSVPIVNYVYNNPQTLPYWRADIDATAPMIENYSAKYGLYPFAREKYGHSMAPFGGGMEHQTMTTQGTFGFDLTSHELMHQWFGDNVTCRSWRDIWLNEGFASYGEYVTLEALRPPDAPVWLADTRQAAMSQPNGSVAVPADDTLNVGRIFDYSLTYQKGAAVVHMLRHVVNSDSSFFAALRTYQREFGGSVATTDDLRKSLEASLRRPLGWFFQQWIVGEGFARTDAGWNQVGNQLVVESKQTATAPGITAFFRMPLEIRVTFAAGGPAPLTLRVDQTQRTQLWTLPIPAGAIIARIELDPNAWNLLQVVRLVRNNALQPVGGVEDVARNPIGVFPNPCTDRLTVSASAEARVAEVLDLAGRVVLRQHLSAQATALATHALAPGTYALRLTTAAGQVRQARFVRR